MKSSEIREQVYLILEDLSGLEVAGDEQSLIEDLYIDSLNMVMLLLNLEETFDFRLDESDMNPYDLICVGDVIRLTEKYEDCSHE